VTCPVPHRATARSRAAPSCVAAVTGDANRTFTAYTEASRDVVNWRVQADQPQRFVMVRDGVQVTVLLEGEPDR